MHSRVEYPRLRGRKRRGERGGHLSASAFIGAVNGLVHHWSTYGTKIIVAMKREAHYVLDEILGNATDIPITEHATG